MVLESLPRTSSAGPVSGRKGTIDAEKVLVPSSAPRTALLVAQDVSHQLFRRERI